MRGKLQTNLQSALQVAFYVSLLGGAACLSSAALASYCPDCIAFAKMMGGLLIATCLCAGLMAYARNEGASTESKVIMHPWSFADLVEVSLTSGTVTIGVVDILLVYGYHILLVADAAAALCGAILLCESTTCLKSDAILYWTLSAACSVVLVGLGAFMIMIFANMPYGILEYSRIYMTNFGGALASAGNHIKAKVAQSSSRG